MTQIRSLVLLSVSIATLLCPGAAIARNKGPVFSGLVPINALSPTALERFKRSSGISEASLDGAYAVLIDPGCSDEIQSGEALEAATTLFRDDPPKTARVAPFIGPQESRPVYHVLGLMTLYCPEGMSDPPSTTVLVRQAIGGSSSTYNAYTVQRPGSSAQVTPCDGGQYSGQLEWMDNWEEPEYLGFLREDGKAWAFALLANGERLIVFDLRGSLLLDQKSWGYTHLIRENNDVVLYTILIDKAPASALDQMPGKDELHKRLALGAWRLWTLRRISKNTNEVLASALVPASRGPHDANPEIERRSAPLVEKARALFAGFRKEGRIVDSLP
jgi:hypothetical protein